MKFGIFNLWVVVFIEKWFVWFLGTFLLQVDDSNSQDAACLLFCDTVTLSILKYLMFQVWIRKFRRNEKMKDRDGDKQRQRYTYREKDVLGGVKVIILG